ncbi:hypothetical protein M422DRAFT_68013 [Sphaerobolus stellatus SS14]|uniref:Peptidase C45 hydrolase domain-containing protein n=1 Tax=Sphaerobolus stellatus (strain SS14) TaxID=990650 RepID=A0A0C9VVM5_SPHS4|nr:hypothetical protein M422DRAFT_68013 [Sphaerobolus stellatus SS14]
MKRLDFKGTPREIGLQHGRLLKPEILRQLKFYEGLFIKKSKLTWPQVLEIARDFEPTLKRETSELYEEMAAIAEGLNEPEIGVLDIIALNCRSEIALGKWSDGCTAVGMKLGNPPKEFLAQNWDWNKEMKENIAVVSIESLGKPKIWMVTEAGIIGKIGFNSSSVGVCLNAIRARPMNPTLPPIHILLRLVLESTSLADAISKLQSLGGCATSAHMLIADSTGSRGVEISPNGICILNEDANGIVAHSNHFILNRLVDEPKWLEDSPFRIERMKTIAGSLLREHTTTPSKNPIKQVRDLFRDRENAPGAICRSEASELGIASLFNIVMELDKSNPKAEVVFAIGSEEEKPVMHMPW